MSQLTLFYSRCSQKIIPGPPPTKFFCRPLKGLLWKSDCKIWSENVFGHCGMAFTFLLFSKKNPKKSKIFKKKFDPLTTIFSKFWKKPMIVDILNFDLKKNKKIQPRSRNRFLKCLSQITLRFEFVPTYPTLPYGYTCRRASIGICVCIMHSLLHDTAFLIGLTF